MSAHIPQNNNGMYPGGNHIKAWDYILTFGGFISITLGQLAERRIRTGNQVTDKFGKISKRHDFDCSPDWNLTIVVDMVMLINTSSERLISEQS